MSVSYNKLGITAEVQGKLSDAEKWYRKCLAINAALAEEVQTFKSYDDLAVSCYRIGKLTANQAMLEQALGIWEKLVEFFPENPKYRRFADIVKKVLQALFPIRTKRNFSACKTDRAVPAVPFPDTNPPKKIFFVRISFSEGAADGYRSRGKIHSVFPVRAQSDTMKIL